MTFPGFILRNLLFFWRKHLLQALGISISAAVITGALIVGDSVRYSLERILALRLGEVTHVLKSGDRYFTAATAERAGMKLDVPLASVLRADGMAVAEGGQKRVNHVQVIGVDSSFDRVAGLQDYYSRLTGDRIMLSSNLARRLDVEAGETILLRMTRASLVPMNAPFVSDRDNVVSLRAEITGIAGEEQLGRFSLEASQTAPFNVFINSGVLRRLMELEGKSNVMLIASDATAGTETLMDAFREAWTLEDAGLKLKELEDFHEIQVSSDRVFIGQAESEALMQLRGLKHPVLTYFVNTLSSGDRSTPYSFVSTLGDQWMEQDEIIINDWLAEDLDAGPGDSLQMKYFVVGPLRELKEETAHFRIRSVVPMTGQFADQTLMPDLPGLSDVGNCRDWETGVPINLEEIRQKDEEYWSRHKGVPKAFISLSRATRLWGNRFGNYTAFRYVSTETTPLLLGNSLLEKLDPVRLGYTVEAVRSRGQFAARNGVDFSQLFGGLSFFLLAGGILLTVLLFLLNLESRKEQLQTLSIMGFPQRIIRRSMLAEGMFVAAAGSMGGLLLAVLYTKLVFIALNGVWKDIVRTEIMMMDIRPTTLIAGLLITLLVSWMALIFPLNRFLQRVTRKYRRRGRSFETSLPRRQISKGVAILSGLAGVGLILTQLMRGEIVNAGIFFAAGGLLLVSGLSMFYFSLIRLQFMSHPGLSMVKLGRKNALRNPTRSIGIVILFALGAFLVISTGSNRKDLFVNAEDPLSGTGGFLYYAESTVPVLRNLNDPEVRFDLGLDRGYSFVQLRMSTGDDASCLNLNRIMNPRILGVDPSRLEGRFRFVTRTPYLDEVQPWTSLEKELDGGLIPAVADETVIKWGMGMKVGDTLEYLNAGGERMNLLLLGGLAPSVFQGSVIISDRHFLEQFPQNSGTQVFLVEGNRQDTTSIMAELGWSMRDMGWDITLASRRLAEFLSVTNTYLSIFFVMGALGLLLGTVGLSIVLFRSILERKQEIALLRAVGYGRKNIRGLVVGEYMGLLAAGTGIGFLCAIIATLPSILSPNTDVSFTAIVILLLILMANGWAWTFLITTRALRNRALYQALRNE